MLSKELQVRIFQVDAFARDAIMRAIAVERDEFYRPYDWFESIRRGWPKADGPLRAAFDPLRSLAVVNSKKHVKWAVGLLTLGLVVAAVIYFLAVRDRTFRS